MSERGARDEDSTAGPALPRERGGKRALHMLRKSAEFEAVLRSGCRIASPNFVLRAQPNQASHARLGIITGRKSAPRAVDRNRAKRLIREVFRNSEACLGSYDVTIQLRSDLRGALNRVIRDELHKLLDSFARRAVERSEGERHRR